MSESLEKMLSQNQWRSIRRQLTADLRAVLVPASEGAANHVLASDAQAIAMRAVRRVLFMLAVTWSFEEEDVQKGGDKQ